MGVTARPGGAQAPPGPFIVFRQSGLYCQLSIDGYALAMCDDLVGAEVAVLLRVSRQRVNRIGQTHDDFPAPVAQFAAGRIWRRAAIEAWAQNRVPADQDDEQGRRAKPALALSQSFPTDCCRSLVTTDNGVITRL